MPRVRSSLVPALVVGLLMIASVGVGAQSDGSVTPPAEFSGFVPCNFNAEETGDVTETVVGSTADGDLIRRSTRHQVWRLTDVQSEDPRFTGTYSTDFDLDAYYITGQKPEDAPTLMTGTRRIENEDGAWQGTFASGSWSGDPGANGWSSAAAMRGEGAYAGMTALWTERYSEELCGWDFRGVVFDAEPPSTVE